MASGVWISASVVVWNSMMDDISIAEKRIREEQRRHDLRASALGKLSEEERLALGL